MSKMGLMNDFDFSAEQRAYASFATLLTEAASVRLLFEAAGVPLPPALERLLGVGRLSDSRHSRVVIPPPPSPPRPAEAKPDWVWVRVCNMTAYSLTLALLRQQKGPLTPKAVVNKIVPLLEKVNPRSVYNLAPRMKEVEVGAHGWTLIDPSKAPLLVGDVAWGPSSVFLPQELTIHRRALILHLLRSSADGMMAMQIVRQLQDSALCKTVVNKDLVKGDIEVLRSEGEIRRQGRTKKWTVTEGNKESKYN